MLKKTLAFCAAFMLAAAVNCPAADAPANALLVVPSETAFNKKFQDFLDKNGAKLLHSHPPSVFIGVIPPELDKQLKEKFGAEVYRDKVDDWASFARYGENAVFAVNAWNKGFQEDPPEAPLVISTRVQKAGRKGDTLKLVWNEVMKARAYRLQISQDENFDKVLLETVAQHSQYKLVPAFWKEGVYFWRVAGIMTLNTGEIAEGAFSEAYTFAVSKPAQAPGGKLGAPQLPEKTRVKGRPLSWAAPAAFKYYRLQLSETRDFEAPLLDVFTDTCTYKLSGLPVKRDTPYYMRVMGSDGASAGDWSAVSEVVLEAPGPIANDMKKLRRRK
ncbi:MAG: fibronectin type III domain-containing protein [Elusimicrobiales bacterium]|nr:fibronectin type III domain-containing protein [Elusimicrobiales bacterium]